MILIYILSMVCFAVYFDFKCSNLERKLSGAKESVTSIRESEEWFLEESVKYKKALEFYAKAPRSSLHEDGGNIAREALK